MPPPIRVKPTSIFFTSPRESLLDGVYTAGVTYVNPLRRGQMSPRLVLFLAAFTTLVFLVSSFKIAVNIHPPLENETFMEDYGSPDPVLRSFDIVPWIPPPGHLEPVGFSGPISTRPSLEKCPRELTRTGNENVCHLENLFTNVTDILGYSTATRLSDAAPAEEVKKSKFPLLGLLLVLLGMLWSRQASRKLPISRKLLHLPRTIYTDNPMTRSLIETWDLSTGSFIPATYMERLYFPKNEEVSQAINGNLGSPFNGTLPSHPSTKPSGMTALRRFFARIWPCGMEAVADIDGWTPVGQRDAADQTRTCGTSILSSHSSMSSFDETYEELEVQEIGIDYSG